MLRCFYFFFLSTWRGVGCFFFILYIVGGGVGVERLTIVVKWLMVFSKGRSHTHTIGKREQTWHYLPIILCDIIMRARGTEARLSSWGVNSPNTNQERDGERGREIIIRIRCSLFVLCSMFSDKQENGIQNRTATVGNTHLQWERRRGRIEISWKFKRKLCKAEKRCAWKWEHRRELFFTSFY